MAMLSIRGYARHRAERGYHGTTHRAVQKAIEHGRITIKDGLIDSDAADRDWARNTNEHHRRNPGEEPAAQRAEAAAPPPEAVAAAGGVTLAQATTLERAYKARIAQLDFQERSGKLVPADEVLAKWQELVVLSRNKVLALPSKIKARLPHLTKPDVLLIEDLVRESLSELADDFR